MLTQFRARNFGRLYNRTRSTRWRLSTEGRIALLALLISGVIGLDTRQNLSFQLFSILASLIIIAAVSSPRSRGQYQAQRFLPPMVTMGQAFDYRILITNDTTNRYCDLLVADKLDGDRPSTSEFKHFRDPLSDSENIFDRIVGFPRWARLAEQKLGAREPAERLEHLPAHQQEEIRFHLMPLRRGYLNFSAIAIGSPDVFGLFFRLQNVTCKDKLLVLPKRYAVPQIALKGQRHYHQGGVSLASAVGESGEFYGLRDYRPRDPLRHIHWRSWARTGKPVVKTFEQEYYVRHALVLDTYASDVPSHHFEEAVSVAASLALHVDDQESLLDLMFVERQRFHITSGRHVESVQSLLEVLACVSPQYNQSIAELSQMVVEHSSVLSNALCIFLRWDLQRQAMVKALQAQGVNVITLIVCDELPENHGGQDAGLQLSQQLFYLQTGHIEEGLARLNKLSIEGA